MLLPLWQMEQPNRMEWFWLWQMLLPLWQMEWSLDQLLYLLFFISFYFILSSEMLNRTSSHMWGRWYLPVFLFRDGMLTHMYIASFISLMMFWSSLPTILKFSNIVIWPVVLKWSHIWGRSFQVFFKPL